MLKKFNSKKETGFTLLELLITTVVASIAMGGILSVYVSQSKAYTAQKELSKMQQDLRAALYLIKNDIRNAGRNPDMNDTVGIISVARQNADADDANGYPGITMTSYVDTDDDGVANTDTIRTISYQVMDADGDGRRELRRQVDNDGNWHLVMDGIEDIGFAYAFDTDQDLDLDRVGNGAAATIIWGVDTDGVTGLDTNVDSNGDGNIDEDDYDAATGAVDASGALAATAELADIRAVQIWLLARSEGRFVDYTDTRTYVLGHKMLDMSLDANVARRPFRHALLSGAVALNNYERNP